jgi:hypothetical protein
LPEEQLGSAITRVAAVLLQVWRQVPLWLLFFLLSKAQAASSAVRPVPANLLSAVLEIPPVTMSISCLFCSIIKLCKRVHSHAESTCKHLVKSPSGLRITVLQKQLRPDKRDGVGQAILTRPVHLNAAMNDAFCATGDCVGDEANREKHDYHSSLHQAHRKGIP